MGNEIREGFVRQRRNLIIGSFLLFFAQLSGIKVGTINVFGNDFPLDEPRSINVFLWIIVVYWFIRFYQYSRDLNFTDEIRNATNVRFNFYIPQAALNCLKDTNPELFLPPAEYPNAKLTPVLRDFSLLEARKQFHRGKVELDVHWVQGTENGIRQSGSIDLIIDKKYLHSPRMRAKFDVFIHTTKFTEYILPFVIFLLPVSYGFLSIAI